VANSTGVVVRIQEPDERVLKLNSWCIRCFDSIWLPDCTISEERVDSNPISFEISNFVSYSESSVANIREVLLICVVWELRLVEINLSLVGIPLNKVS
jgi:hypothetical protein